ncbi:hypothetical protein LOTGIDRAFT_155490 [Lottia gigantea]|uniref:Uncharacterized protein n=1 Tax=Lottia gigantea TaxID=225164 RepID=V3ZIV0_LOTGI|nr:hypothetical protein LOTGIDRAFT_155490 [Lottia gigantea]ESO84167.1 hypothetical protein LOTGIDRAFT_155490 [Lottia gigantea]
MHTKLLFMDAFIQNNRVPNIIQLMSYHPDYLDCFLKTQHYLLHEDGPLPFDYRHYIAIMACGRHQCSYLIKLQAQEFLLHGGNADWLKGIDYIPQKLKDFLEINKILAHRPWLITKEHVEKLITGKNRWSLSELTHAIILCTHFHALSTFVFGCGLNDEIDFANGHTFSPSYVDDNDNYSSDSSNDNCDINNNNIVLFQSKDDEGSLRALMARMKELSEKKEEEELTVEERLKEFAKVESLSAEIATSQKIPSPSADVLRYVEDPTFAYTDFATRESVMEIPSFRANEYSWEEHGFSLANRLYSDIGSLLDDKFNMAYNLTYYTMGDNTQVDTSSFRKAIWSYIHTMYGIRHDDYKYGEVNQLLERNLKAYIKTVTCYPERLTKKDYDGVMREFKHSEKVHVNLMLLEARLQAELLYALRAIMKYMT